MIIKYLKKIFDNIYLTREADVINNEDNKIITGNKVKIDLKTNSKKKFFYIIQRSPGAGMFSNLIFVLNHLKICERHGFTPVVDMKNYPTIYNEKNKIFNTLNSWNYYFEPVSNVNLNQVYNSGKIITCSSLNYKNFEVCSKDIKKIYKKYIKIKKIYKDEAEIFANKFIKENKVLAIHYRGTSYKTSAGHPYPPTFKQMKNLINQIFKNEKYNKIFLCTEDLDMFQNLKKFYKNKLIYKDSYRSYKDDAFKIYPRKNHRFKLGKEIIVEALIISKCKGFLSTETNISNFVNIIMKNNKPKFYKIENGYNSTNEYYAMWLWYLKKILPSSFGGFKDFIKVSYPKFN
jgi:hypothetical protein